MPRVGAKIITFFRPWVWGLLALEARRPKKAFVHGRRNQEGKSPFSQKTCVFCLQRGLSSSHALFFNMEPKKKKKNQMCSFLSEVLLEAAGKSGLLQARRAGPRAGRGWGLCPTRCQCPASRGLHIPTQKALWKTKCPSAPPRKGVHGDDGGRQPWCSWGSGFFNRVVWVCVCMTILGCAHSHFLALHHWHGWPGPTNTPFWNHSIFHTLFSDAGQSVSFPTPEANRWVLT